MLSLRNTARRLTNYIFVGNILNNLEDLKEEIEKEHLTEIDKINSKIEKRKKSSAEIKLSMITLQNLTEKLIKKDNENPLFLEY